MRISALVSCPSDFITMPPLPDGRGSVASVRRVIQIQNRARQQAEYDRNEIAGTAY